MIRIGIIGGGASGLMAAIAAKRANKAADVFILEHRETLGKKILSTGNGRCNLTNEVMDMGCFRSEQMEVVKKIMEEFDTEQTFTFFSSIGVMLKSKNGYVYPRSAQAASIVQAFMTAVDNLGIQTCTNMHVTSIDKTKKGFQIYCENRSFSADKVILSTGGKAAAVLGSDGSGYALAKSMGHSLVPVVPALVQLKAANNPLAKAAGVRTDAKVTAMVDGQTVASDMGELQITAYGISGIPIFQISRFIAKALYEKKRTQVEIDFIPEMEAGDLKEFLICRAKKEPQLTATQFMESIFPQKLNGVLLKLAGLHPMCSVSELTVEQLSSLVAQCKCTRVTIAETNGFENAQVCAGGVSLAEIIPKTMESKCADGLYLTGELLDADGMCGGYNLQWAWATGYLAGIATANKE